MPSGNGVGGRRRMSTATTEYIDNYTPAVAVPHGKSAAKTRWGSATFTTLFILAHLPLAYAAVHISYVSTLHAVATFAVGIWCAAFGKRLMRVAYVGAYIVGSEVFWRMNHAHIFWEAGKYALVIIFVIAAWRARRQKSSPLPFIYFALLIPSIMITITNLDLSTARNAISFNLSGPLALAASVWFFSKIKITPSQFRGILLALIGATMAVAGRTMLWTMTAKAIDFGNRSNFTTSGGFGPNQVASILGLGALASFIYLMDRKVSPSLRFVFFCTMTLYATQSALTLAREGVYEFALGMILYVILQSRDSRSGLQFAVIGIVVFFIASRLLLPHLEHFTGGEFGARFDNTNPTGRGAIIMDDIQVWRDNPLFGIGPGRSMYYHENSMFENAEAAHTEFSRLLAEHGLLGLLALFVLAAMFISAIRKAQSRRARALTICLASYAFAFMAVAAMRIAAPSFIFGLATATFVNARKREPLPSADTPVALAGEA